MSERPVEQRSARSILAMVVLKGGLVLGAVWALALLAVAARALLAFVE